MVGYKIARHSFQQETKDRGMFKDACKTPKTSISREKEESSFTEGRNRKATFESKGPSTSALSSRRH